MCKPYQKSKSLTGTHQPNIIRIVLTVVVGIAVVEVDKPCVVGVVRIGTRRPVNKRLCIREMIAINGRIAAPCVRQVTQFVHIGHSPVFKAANTSGVDGCDIALGVALRGIGNACTRGACVGNPIPIAIF